VTPSFGGAVRVRLGVREDVAAIAAIRVAGWRTAYAGLIEQVVLDAMDPVADQKRWLAAWNADASGRVVADLGGSVAGFVMTCPYRFDAAVEQATWPTDGRAGEIAALYVDPARQGHGVGRALMARALADLLAAGHPVVRLWVLAGNARARRFYEGAGFVDESPLGVTNDFVPHGGTHSTPEVRYSRALP
jgi:ribosomal protein S18 acetylase RimI-like enzyme